ncbi:MAG: hypothetical protein AB7O49_11205 [Sphingomonadales bacterium]
MSEEIAIETLSEAEIPDTVALWKLCNLTRPWNDPHADAVFALGPVEIQDSP